ncbi:response regulator transcription factor [Roseomonas genomospecies 6]|uniref:DNA-binding response regulator n=1 Tax=Roseomonas genomospecies 6 TaxID=214106 RepID=A0A9W7NI84_9PROT|nr:response regulator transcription factor [Roseomonas genomospecies 6]KAA0679447.1 DNA-binding response regulator [Roseomonas genomospecies 6]
MKILVASTAPLRANRAVNALASALRGRDHIVETATGEYGQCDLDDLRARVRAYRYDVTVLLAPEKACEGVKALSRHDGAGALIVLGSVGETARLLEDGAAAVLSASAELDEIEATVLAVCRRVAGAPDHLLEIGPLTVDYDAKRVLANGQSLDLSAREFALLELLARHAGAPIMKAYAISCLYGDPRLDDDREGEDLKIVDVFVCKLRKKLKAAGLGNLITTVWARGYSLDIDGRAAAAKAKPARTTAPSEATMSAVVDGAAEDATRCGGAIGSVGSVEDIGTMETAAPAGPETTTPAAAHAGAVTMTPRRRRLWTAPLPWRATWHADTLSERWAPSGRRRIIARGHAGPLIDQPPSHGAANMNSNCAYWPKVRSMVAHRRAERKQATPRVCGWPPRARGSGAARHGPCVRTPVPMRPSRRPTGIDHSWSGTAFISADRGVMAFAPPARPHRGSGGPGCPEAAPPLSRAA